MRSFRWQRLCHHVCQMFEDLSPKHLTFSWIINYRMMQEYRGWGGKIYYRSCTINGCVSAERTWGDAVNLVWVFNNWKLSAVYPQLTKHFQSWLRHHGQTVLITVFFSPLQGCMHSSRFKLTFWYWNLHPSVQPQWTLTSVVWFLQTCWLTMLVV